MTEFLIFCLNKMNGGLISVLIGVILYAIGVGWLFYLDVKIKYYYTSDNNKMNNNVAWAVMLALVGVLLAAAGGVIFLMG